MNSAGFIQRLKEAPGTVEFDDTIELIDSLYEFTPTAFRNGAQFNAAGENSGSCKIFAFAQLHHLDEAATLACFGRYYREDVLGFPDGHDHANIRSFMQTGWDGVRFEEIPLRPA